MRVPSISILLYFTGEYYTRYIYYINHQEIYCIFSITHFFKMFYICIIKYAVFNKSIDRVHINIYM